MADSLEEPPNMVPYEYSQVPPAFIDAQPKSMASNLLYVSGPNAVGKDTMLHGLAKRCPGMTSRVARTTSRPPRPEEVEGVEYEFRSEEEILENWRAYVAIARYPGNGHLYAISRQNIERTISRQGMVAVSTAGLEFGPILKALYPRSTSIYILPQSLDDLLDRLKQRGSSEAEVMTRWQTAKAEIEAVFSHREAGTNGHFDKYLVNGDLESTLDRFANIVREIGEPDQSGYRDETDETRDAVDAMNMMNTMIHAEEDGPVWKNSSMS